MLKILSYISIFLCFVSVIVPFLGMKEIVYVSAVLKLITDILIYTEIQKRNYFFDIVISIFMGILNSILFF